MSVPVKLWWDNRHKLNAKMLTSLRDELKTMRVKAEVTILMEQPVFGEGREEHDRKNASLLAELDEKIAELEEMLVKF